MSEGYGSRFDAKSDRIETKDYSGYIQTYSGGIINPLDPDEKDIKIEDIAHALACLTRFGGHLKCFYSVAQHSVLVSRQCPEEDQLWGLLHDASEAYLSDVCRPLKRHGKFGPAYMETEARLMGAVCRRFGLPVLMPTSVHEADNVLLKAEAATLLNHITPEIWKEWPTPQAGIKIDPWTWEQAEAAFLSEFFHLGGKG